VRGLTTITRAAFSGVLLKRAQAYLHGRSTAMKRLIFAGVLLLASGSMSLADGLFWVVGNRATGKCNIVTSNPVIIGDIWFGDGPYKSRADAKLARSTIRACPAVTPDEDKDEDGTN
jgi:hypothetical protein